jgi:hypothetical protein
VDEPGGECSQNERFLIEELLVPRRERLSVLFDQTLDVIEDALEARRIFLVKGTIVDGGLDHYARLFIRLVSSRR